MLLGKFLRVRDGQTTNAADYWFRIDEVSGFLVHFLAPQYHFVATHRFFQYLKFARGRDFTILP